MLGTKQLAFIGIGATAIAGGSAGIYYFQQNKTTIRDKLNSEGIKLISTDEEYWVSFKETKKDPELINLIKNGDNTYDTWDARKGGNSLKVWCDNNLKLNIPKENAQTLLDKVKKYCSKPPLTIGEKISKLGKKWVTKWNEKLEALKKPNVDTELVGELKKINDKVTGLDISDTQAVIKALEDWCKGNNSKRLISPETDAIWAKLEKRCFETSTTTQKNDG
ncbi:hypothetical protein A6V39_00395 [Candidatus Mycoplasma haematobovis]|uniref:Uncharacterized protein n=1 Tax=Candidatus Mycoplasma haematobovis TaxID=432608 RepID=A0A1A9QFL7_9MOLU|nr:hypothetical protein [Candidatus Mycoplasma haematobovis]OAL10509.1 hypothetical protein A6V39_00395 [Candidatus Mycoplasma haematobovis]